MTRRNSRVTEEEATKLLCCGPAECGISRDGARYCAGNACMAWRWARNYVVLYTCSVNGKDPERHETPTGMSDTQGYCGFAAEDLLPRTTVMPRG